MITKRKGEQSERPLSLLWLMLALAALISVPKAAVAQGCGGGGVWATLPQQAVRSAPWRVGTALVPDRVKGWVARGGMLPQQAIRPAPRRAGTAMASGAGRGMPSCGPFPAGRRSPA